MKAMTTWVNSMGLLSCDLHVINLIIDQLTYLNSRKPIIDMAPRVSE